MFRYAACVVMMLFVGIGNVWGTDIDVAPGTWFPENKTSFPYGLVTISHSSTAASSGSKISSNAISTGTNGDVITITFTATKSDMYVKSVTFTDLSSGTLSSDDGTITDNVFTASSNKNSVSIVLTSNSGKKGSVKVSNVRINTGTNTVEKITFTSVSSGTVNFTSSAGTSALTSITSDGSPSVSSNILTWPNSKTLVFTSSRNILYAAFLVNDGKSYTGFSASPDTYSNCSWNGSSKTVTFTNGTGGGRVIKEAYVIVEPAAAKAYTVTVESNNDSWGTVAAGASSLDASETTTITATPASGYRVASWAVSGTGATISPSGSSHSTTTTLTMGSANATVTCTFEAIPTHSISYTNLKGADNSANPTSYTEGVGVASFTKLRHVVGYDFSSWSPSSISSSATTDQTIDAQWTARAAATGTGTLTYALGYSDNTITTSSITRTNGALYDATDLTWPKGVTIDDSESSERSGKITTTSSYDSSKYLSLTFKIADGYTFTPTEVQLKAVAVTNDKTIRFEFTDNAATPNTKYLEQTRTNGSSVGTLTYDFDASDPVTLTGTVTVKIYAYGATNSWRLGTPITITGTVAEEVASGCSDWGLHYGTDGEDDWTEECFTQVGSTHEWQITNFVIPEKTWWYVDNAAGNDAKKNGGSWSNLYFAASQGNGDRPMVGQATGAVGTVRIYDDSGWNNRYAGFIPNGYKLKFGSTEYAMSVEAGNEYRSEIVEYSSSTANNNVSVGIVDASGDYVATDNSEGMQHIFLNTGGSSLWSTASASNFGVFDVTHSTWTCLMVKVPGEDYLYEGWVPSSCATVSFHRLASSSLKWKTNDSDGTNTNVWNSTGDKSLESSTNVFTIANWSEDNGNSGGSWSAYEKSGKFRMNADYTDKNWYVRFVPHHKLTYNANGGSGAPEASYASVESVPCQWTLSTTQPTREGYTFLGWNTSSSATEPGSGMAVANLGTPFGASDDVTLYAVWQIKTYTVTYNAGTGTITGSHADDTKTHGVNLTLPGVTFSKTGYTQTGWATTDGGSKAYELGGSYTANAAADLYPVWTAKTTAITLDKNGGDTDGSATATYGSNSLTSLTHATRTGYTQNGYETSDHTLIIKADETFDGTREGYTSSKTWINESAAVTLYARWEANKYNVTHTLSNVSRSSGGEAGSNKATYGTAYSVVFAASSGYTLPAAVTVTVGGSDITANCTWNQGTGALTIPAAYVTGDIVITVTGVEVTYTVTYEYNGADGGTRPVSNSGNPLPSPTKTGYTLDGWYASDGTFAGAGGATSYVPEDDITLYAQWQSTSCAGGGGGGTAIFTFTVNDSGDDLTVARSGGSLSLTTSNAFSELTGGTVTAVNANTNSGGPDKMVGKDNSERHIRFAATSSYLTLTMSNDLAEGDTIKFTGNGSAQICITTTTTYSTTISTSSNKYTIPKNSTLIGKSTIYVWPSSTSTKIKTLSVKRAGGGTCYFVTYNGNGADGGYTTDETAHANGSNVTVASNSFTKTGYTFTGWNTEDDGSGTAYSAGGTISGISSNMTLYAQWSAEAAALITNTLATGNVAWSSSITTAAPLDITNLSALAATGLTISGNGNTSNGGQTAKVTGTETTKKLDEYLELSFRVACGKKLTVTGISIPVQPVSSNTNNFEAVLTDGTNTITGTLTNKTNGTLNNIEFDSYGYVQGTVTLRIYAWGWTDGYRLGTAVKIFGTIENQATPAATIRWTTQPAGGLSGTNQTVAAVSSDGSAVTITSNNTSVATVATVAGVTTVSYVAAGSTYLVASGTDACGNAMVAVNSDNFTVIGAYDLTYDKNGGTGTMTGETGVHYATVKENGFTAPSGKVFDSWNTAADGSGDSYMPDDEIELSANTTLYAQWGTTLSATWSVTKVDSKLYRGGGGYSVTVYLDQADWDASGDKEDLELTATEGVTLKNIVKSINASGKAQVAADFDITTGVAADATEITFTLSVPAAGSYAAAELENPVDLDECGGGSGSAIYKFQVKTGLGSSATNISSSVKAATTDNYLSVIEGGTLAMTLSGNGNIQTNKDSMLCLHSTSGYLTPTLSAGTLQRGDIVIYRSLDNIIHMMCGTSYSALTDVILPAGNKMVAVNNSMHGRSSVNLTKNSSDANIKYFEVMRPSSVLFFAEVNNGIGTSDIGSGTDETALTAGAVGEGNILSYVSGGTLYTKASSAGKVKGATNEIQLTDGSDNTYIKIALNNALAAGDMIVVNSTTTSYPLGITTSSTRSTTILGTYKIPVGSSMIGQTTIYLWRNSSNSNFKTIAVVRPGAGGSSGATPTLSWSPALASDGGDWNIAESRLDKETGDADFTFVATQDKNSLGAITYSSSNPSVATVNATTGKVHIVGEAGEATITATLAASGCFDEATATYTINVVDNCIDVAGTIGTEDLGCDGIQMTVTGHTATASVSYQWYKDGATISSATSATYTATTAGEYYVVVDNSAAEGDHCAMASTNTVVVVAKAAATATKIVDSWYVKNGRRTPDIELVQTTGAESFTVTNGSSTVIWNSDGSVKTGFGGCGFHMDENGIIYLNGTKDNGDATSDLTAGDETLTITVYGCGSSASANITIHKQAATARKSIAFVVDGTEEGAFNAENTSHGSSSALYAYLDYTTSGGTGAFDLTAQNIYSTIDEKAIREHYSQFDAILITDDPSTKKPAKNYETKGYVNAFGTMIDVRPILTMEAYVSALANWKTKGIAGTPTSPNPRQYELRLECKDHEIYKAGLPDAAPGSHVWDEVVGGETYRHIILVDSTKSPYAGLAYNEQTGGNQKPALQGFTGAAAGSLLGLGRILDGTLQAAIERQEEPAARLLVFSIQALALPNALTAEGKQIIENILNYLLKTNMEEVDDCSNYFTDKTGDHQWSTVGNWSKDGLPLSEAKVRILAPCEISGIVPHVAQVDIASSGKSGIRNNATGSAECNGSLTIASDGALIVNGKVRTAVAPHFGIDNLKPTTPEDLTINTSSTAQAALILNNDDGQTQATVNLYSLGRNDGSYKYQYFAIPMEYLDVSPTFANENHGGTKIYTYVYEEASSGWTRRGYYDGLYAFEGLGITTKSATAMEYTMTGTLASTTAKEITLTHDGAGLNLVGNSWMAPIQIGALSEDNTDANITKTVYVYSAGRDAEGGALSGDTETAGQWLAVPFEAASFATWIETGKLSVIPAMQAFQIKTAAEATLTLDYNKVVRGSTNDLNAKLRAPARRDYADEDEVKLSILRVSDSKTHTDLSLFEGGRFSDEFDNGWEAEYLSSDGRSAQFYARGVNGKMAVLATNELEGTKVGFEPGREREYTIRVMGSGINYYLNDLKEKKSMLICEGNTYSFTYEEGDEANRFLISGTPFEAPQTPTDVGQAPSDQVQGTKVQKVIYQDKVYIIRGGKIYDIIGKVVK